MKKLLIAGLLALVGGPVFAQEVPEGQRWIQQLDGGLFLPLSSNASNGYDPGYGGDMGVGYRFTRSFSLSLLLGYYDLDQRFYGAGAGEWIYVPLQLSARYTFALDRFRPYVSLGIGAAFNNYSLSTGTGGSPPKGSRTDTDFLLSPGIGVLYILGGDMAFFLQGRLDMVFLPTPKAGQPLMDSPTLLLPIMAGISFFPTK